MYMCRFRVQLYGPCSKMATLALFAWHANWRSQNSKRCIPSGKFGSAGSRQQVNLIRQLTERGTLPNLREKILDQILVGVSPKPEPHLEVASALVVATGQLHVAGARACGYSKRFAVEIEPPLAAVVSDGPNIIAFQR